MKGFDVLKIKSAVKARNRIDLSAPVLATMDIGQIVPLGTWELIPGDDFKVKMRAFSRNAPMVEPTFGSVHFKTVCGFVPYHQIAYDSDAWLAGKTTFEGQTPHHRYITIADLYNFMYSYCGTTSGATATNCDFSYTNSSGTTIYMIFSNVGRYYWKVMNALGYALPQGVDLQASSAWSTTIKNIKLSAYPLLAFFKMYNDYMSQSQRFNTSQLSDYLLKIKQGVSVTNVYDATYGRIYSAGIATMFGLVLLNYENDYFTSAWQNPNFALAVGEGLNSVNVPESVGSALVAHGQYDTYLFQDNGAAAGGTSLSLGQRSLDMLRSFDNWVRRNNYSGSRSVQQLYSRFGIKTDDFRTHYAHILKTDSIPVQIGDVTSTAATTPSGGSTIPLGDYAGKGIMSGNISCGYKSSDYGMLFVFGYYTVTPLNPYGFDRSVLRRSPLDYYNPEFDGIGADAIPLMEFFENPRGVAESDTTRSDSVFGFTERYNAYRFGRSKILGDWRKFDGTDPINSWHLGRLLGSVRKAGNLVAQSSAVNTLPQVGSEYNRIFNNTSADVDHFYLTCWFDVSAIRPMLNLNQVVDLGEGDTNVPRNGNVVS